MAVQTYGGPYNPTSTASNQNQFAQMQQRQQPQDYARSFQVSQNNNQSNPYTSAWATGTQQASNSSPWTVKPPVQQPLASVTGNQAQPSMQPSQPPQPQRPYQAPTPWSPQVPTAQTWTPSQQATTQTWTNPTLSDGTPWTTANFNTQALRDQYTAYMQATLPWMQFQQNNQQYAQDFNEAARRWDTQNQWQQSMDRYNMDLTGRAQTMAEWQAQEAARQWGEQFGWQQQNDLFSQGLAQQQITGDQWYQGEQVRLADQAQAIEDAYNQGRLTNEQRAIALQELQQQQNDAYRYYELARQQELAREQQANQLGFSREELAATQAYRQQQDALAREQMQQQLQMQQAELEAQRQNAILQATGRAAGIGPSARWMSRF